MIQLINRTNVPMGFEVGTDQGRAEGLESSGYVGPLDISRFQALKTEGTFGIFLQSFLWEEGKKVFYAAKADPSKPAMIAFRNGAYHAVVADLDESGKPRFSLYNIPAAPAGASAAAGATTAPAAAPRAALTSVPASWNGDYAEETRPGRAALSVHDGKIWSVFGGSQTETFPGPSRLYQFSYGENECRSVEKGNGKEYERYAFDAKTGKLIYHLVGQAPTVYVPMNR
jgi:hypothetical protein